MACNKYKNKNYKSALQTFNNATQAIEDTNIVTAPVSLALGSKVTDTGCAFQLGNNGIYVAYNGLYRIDANIEVDGVTDGNVTFALTLNGEVLPETVRTISMVATINKVLALKTERVINICNTFGEYNFGVIAWSDGTGEGIVNRVSMTAVKDA